MGAHRRAQVVSDARYRCAFSATIPIAQRAPRPASRRSIASSARRARIRFSNLHSWRRARYFGIRRFIGWSEGLTVVYESTNVPFEVVPLAPALGAEIRGVDLNSEIATRQLGALKAAWI